MAFEDVALPPRPDLGFAGMECQNPFSTAFALAAPGCSSSFPHPAQQHGSCPQSIRSGAWVGGPGLCVLFREGVPAPRWWQQPESVVLWWEVPALAAVPGSLAAGRVVAVFPRSAPGVIAQMGTWGNSHPSPGMVMSEEDSKTNGSLRSSAALQDFSSHQPLHQQRQHLSRSLSQPWRRNCQAAGAGAKINHVLNNVPSPSNIPSSSSRPWSGAVALHWSPGAPRIWGWCLGSAHAQGEGMCQGRAEPGEMSPASGCHSPLVMSGCQGPPEFFWVLESPSPFGVPASCAGFCGLLSGLSKHFLLHSYLQILSLCSSFMTFKTSCLIPFFQRCPVGSCPSQPSAGSACLQLLCFLLLTVIGFDFLIAARVFSVIFTSCSHCFPLSLILFPFSFFPFPFSLSFSSLFLPLSFPIPFPFFTFTLSLSPFSAKLGDLLLNPSFFPPD